jgi:stress response protein SCP2
MARRRGVLATFVQIQRDAERDRERRARAAAKGQRDAERTAAARSRASVQDQKVRDRLYAEERTREAAEDTAQLDQQIEVLQNVLAATLAVDDHLDLEALKQAPSAPAFDPSNVGPPPLAPEAWDFAVEGPSTLGRVFSGAKHAARAQQGQTDYQKALDEHNVATQRHTKRLEEARRRHEADAARQAEEHRQHVEQVSELQRGLAERRPDAVVRYLDLVLEAAEYPDGFPHSWRLGYAAASGHLTIDYELPALDVVPADKSYKYAKSTDSLTASPRPAAQVRSVYTEVLRQTALRVVHEVLEADRAAVVRTVVFNGYVSGTDPATGREVRPCVVALATSRERFLDVDLARVDTVACLAHLEARVSKDPSKLQAVQPIVLEGSLQADYTLDTESEADREGASVQVDQQAPAEAVASGRGTEQQQQLLAGQNVPLTAAQVHVHLEARDSDLSVLLVGASGRVDTDEDFIFYNNPGSADGAVILSGNSASINTGLLNQLHERVVLVVSTSEAPSIADATAVLSQPGTGADLRFQPADSTQVAALVWGEIYLREGAWRLRAVGRGWTDGLAGLARDYGVDVG